MIDRHDIVVTELTDAELYVIATGGRTDDDLQTEVISLMASKDD